MNGDADAYHEAANERLVDAFMLYQMRRYVLSLYSSGVAVECMFRAHRLRFDPVFDSRHDLHELCKASKIKQELSVDQAKRLAEALTALARLWRNDYRFELERVVRRLLKAREA